MSNIKSLKRTLVIDCKNLESVKLLSSALQIKIVDAAFQSFPLRRIKNVCVIGDFNCNLSDLLKVVKIGIPITWKSSCTAQAVHMVPEKRSNFSLENEMECLLFDEKVIVRFREYVECFQLHVSSLVKESLKIDSPACQLPSLLQKNNIILHKGSDIQDAKSWFYTFIYLDWQQAANEYGFALNNPVAKFLFENFRYTAISLEEVFVSLILKQNEPFESRILGKTYNSIQHKISAFIYRYLYQTESLVASTYE